jgi:hypothetical protein
LELLGELDIPVRRCHERQLGHLAADQLLQLIELLKIARGPHELPGQMWSQD